VTLRLRGMFIGHAWLCRKRDVGSKQSFMGNRK